MNIGHREANSTVTTQSRVLRADAQRNRDRLLAAASDLFAANGVDVPLEDIARRADVGIGTLYRHFPTRNALIEAVYRREVALLCDAAGQLLATGTPIEALTAWLHRFVDYVVTKRGMASAIKEMIGADSELFADTKIRIQETVTRLVETARASGDIRGSIEPMQLLRAVSGVCMACDPLASNEADQVVDVLIDGLRHGPVAPARRLRSPRAKASGGERRTRAKV